MHFFNWESPVLGKGVLYTYTGGLLFSIHYRRIVNQVPPKLLQYSVQNSTFFHTIWFHYSRLSVSLRIIPMTEIKSHFCVCLLGLSNRQIVYDLSTKINGLVEHFHKLYVHNKIDLNTLYIPSCVHTCSKINT